MTPARVLIPALASLALGAAVLTPMGAQASVPPLSGAADSSSATSAPALRSAPDGDPWVVSLGDSYISGEAGRWAGNESLTTSDIDALGRAAYWDAGDRESIERCHRSRSAGIHIGVVKSLNLACSGAITKTQYDKSGNFKPGIDFYDQGGRKGQALMLQEFASEHNVKMVALSIGGNDFRFADIVEQCVKDFLVPVASPKCKNDATVNSYLSAASVEKVRADIVNAILNVARAMEGAGYQDGDWTLVLQLYPQPVPGSGNMRYGEFGYDRQAVGGCGFRDADLDWATGTVLPLINDVFRSAGQIARSQRPALQLTTMDTSRAFQQRQLCHDAVWRVQETNVWGSRKGPSSWRDADAVDRSEWVMEINIINAGETYQQESLHPNYWGQLALRNCWRQVWNDGDVRGGACERDPAAGLTADCEPRMTLAVAGRSARATPARERDGARVTLRCPGIAVDPGETALLRGRVTGGDADTKVSLQVRWDGRAWRGEGTKRPAANGAYRFTMAVPVSAPAGRAYQWRVVVTSGAQTVATSQVRTSLVR